MLEVEMKFPVPSFQALERRLAECGAKEVAQRQDEDQYFNAPDRDFARTDEAFRLRRIGKENFVTYKGPKQDLHTKTRPEIEVGLAPGAGPAQAFHQIVTNLGYRPTAVVKKRRRVYHLERDGFPMVVCLDEVEELGTFAELEILAEEDRLEAAKAVLLKTAADLGLTASERRSYLQLLLIARGKK
jgi:adenylate cyclase class 2